MEYIELKRMRMEPDIYTGPNCDEHRPRWITSAEKEGDGELTGDIVLDPSLFPPGTRVIIEIPVCPKCGEDYELCNSEIDRDCDFDWKQWVESEYS